MSVPDTEHPASELSEVASFRGTSGRCHRCKRLLSVRNMATWRNLRFQNSSWACLTAIDQSVRAFAGSYPSTSRGCVFPWFVPAWSGALVYDKEISLFRQTQRKLSSCRVVHLCLNRLGQGSCGGLRITMCPLLLSISSVPSAVGSSFLVKEKGGGGDSCTADDCFPIDRCLACPCSNLPSCLRFFSSECSFLYNRLNTSAHDVVGAGASILKSSGSLSGGIHWLSSSAEGHHYRR